MILREWRGPLLVGAVLRVLAWSAGLWSAGWIQTDTQQYWSLASYGMAGYNASSGWLYNWGLMRPPGYPAILATLRMINNTYAGVSLMQVGFGLAAIALTYALASRVTGKRAATLAAWWLALSPIHIIDSSILLTEIPFSVFLLIAVFLLAPIVERDSLEGWRWSASGFALGMATLIRPVAFYLPLAVLFVMALSRLRRRLLVPALLFLIAFALPVGGWLARNYRVTGVATISTIQGINLAYYRAAGAMAVEDKISIGEAQQRMLNLIASEGGAGLNLAERAQVETRVGLREIFRHPWGYMYTAVRGLAYTLVGPARSHFVERLRGTSLEFLTPPLVAASAASAILLSIGSMIGALAWFRAREWRKLLLLGLPLAYFLLVGSGHEAWARFRVPLEPLMVIFAAVGALYIYRAIRVS
jgi:4-amino-4-deoxy-L-arabinose transferase-like glycosyltransferase